MIQHETTEYFRAVRPVPRRKAAPGRKGQFCERVKRLRLLLDPLGIGEVAMITDPEYWSRNGPPTRLLCRDIKRLCSSLWTDRVYRTRELASGPIRVERTA